MLFGVVIEAGRLAVIGDHDRARRLLAVATRDPAATTELHKEIERVAVRLDATVDDIQAYAVGPDDDLESTVAGILG